jgi:hypothetical protein
VSDALHLWPLFGSLRSIFDPSEREHDRLRVWGGLLGTSSAIDITDRDRDWLRVPRAGPSGTGKVTCVCDCVMGRGVWTGEIGSRGERTDIGIGSAVGTTASGTTGRTTGAGAGVTRVRCVLAESWEFSGVAGTNFTPGCPCTALSGISGTSAGK